MPATKEKKFEVQQHPFSPGDKVAVHDAQATEIERNEGRPPTGKEESTATVEKDGKLEISAPEGTYALSRVPKKDEEDDGSPTRYVVVTVK